MSVFTFEFEVEATIEEVRAFHSDAKALKMLTPPPMWMRLRHSEPMADGSVTAFTLWLGPIPIHWTAVHQAVSADGFTDIQAKGPFEMWQHRHGFEQIAANRVRVSERIEYQHKPGLKGVFTRLLFSPLALKALFTYRSLITSRALRASADRRTQAAAGRDNPRIGNKVSLAAADSAERRTG